ncbi:MAG: sigma-70 family RNA polymerase sigma factor [Saprospiraceae bacterium]|nr:sigma-70 family RNA polymerase sigma factor [Saprospiraceae bacterium]MCF8250739.1 sigma-70 family RNA polymerase sigma factor [Saprospiraceae bacterium]MCF8279796.1 sigma-70 family RNA polymerase sigma factor [Bacteroidales bacterium]MCF8310499.1 sigma-70 family RNA polymerase sigma factor [Saprospiraceae bacterium]MCF8440869.1 sigma-70 family RNA polymerase sigma factor [Saprospiraceae bacterium]
MENNYSTINPKRQSEKITGAAFMYHQLRGHDPKAVRLLCEGIKRHLQLGKYGKATSAEDQEELVNDTAVFVLRKIGDGTFSFIGVSPLSYAKTVADNLLRNFCRRKRQHWQALETVTLPIQPEVEAYFTQIELKNQVENALSKLSEASQLVIRLKYFEDLKDEEIVRDGLSPHRTTDSLKSARCRSLKRLAVMMGA